MTLFTEITETTKLVLVGNTIEECLISKEEHQVLIDCACPTTVAGVEWIKSFISKLNEEERKLVKVKKSARIYKFGGGEKRNSLCEIQFPCHLAKTNVHMRTEVVEADLPLLLGKLYTEENRSNNVLQGKQARDDGRVGGHGRDRIRTLQHSH